MSPSPQSSDDEAPESFTFHTLKKAAKGQEAAVQKHRATEKQKQKEKNRIRDKALKERASKTKGPAARKEDISKTGGEDEGLEDGAGPSELEARMERAMREAAAESGDEDGEAEAEDGDDESDEMGSAEDDDDEEMDGVSEADEESDGDGEDKSNEGSATHKKPKKNPDYLPDHLFETVFSHPAPVASSSKQRSTFSGQKTTEQSTRKRKRSRKSNKDIVVGSRTIRTLSAVTEVPTLRPTRGVNMFLKRSLNVNGSDKHAKTKGWERRAANIGVMRTSGPAAHFVRNV